MGALIVVWLLIESILIARPARPVPPPVPSAARCTTNDLHVAPGRRSGAMGTSTAAITLRNISGDRCSLRGFPSLTFLGCRRQISDTCPDPSPLRLREEHWRTYWGAPRQPRRVTLQPGQYAEFRLGMPIGGYLRYDQISSIQLRLVPHGSAIYLPLRLPVAGPPHRRDVIGIGFFVPGRS